MCDTYCVVSATKSRTWCRGYKIRIAPDSRSLAQVAMGGFFILANEEDASREAGHIIRATTKYREYSLFGQDCDIMRVIKKEAD